MMQTARRVTLFSRDVFVTCKLAIFMTVVAACLALGSRALAGEAPHVAFVQIPRNATKPAGKELANTLLAKRYLLGSRIVVAQADAIAEARHVLSEDFACAADPSFSADGARLTFVGSRRPDQPLQVWETTVVDSATRQAVTSDADCAHPSYLPNGCLVFASLLSGEYEEHGRLRSFSLYSVAPGSNMPDRLTFNPSSDFDPCVLPDGRILYTSWQHVGNHYWPRGNTALLLINHDGTGVSPLTGNHRDPWLKRGATPIGRDGIAFVQSSGFGEFGAGELVLTDLNDPFAPYQPLVSASRYQVTDAAALPNGDLIFSGRPTDGSRETFGLYLLAGETVRLLYDDPAYHELAPAVGASHDPPELRISTVVPNTPHGYLLILNCKETDRVDPQRFAQRTLHSVRVIGGLPLRSETDATGRATEPEFFSPPGREDEPLVHAGSATGSIPSRILGEVTPAADGSVYLKVPANQPLRIQLIDREGFVILNERAWFWVRPNERRACIGCHEDRELSPRNAVPLAARQAPADLTDSSRWKKFSFKEEIQPLVEKTCAVSKCHVPPTPTAAMNLSPRFLPDGKDAVLADRFGPAYANLIRRQPNKPYNVGGRRVHPGDARRSPLLWMLYGRVLAPQYEPAPFERPIILPHPGPMLPQSDLEKIRCWVDLGAVYSDCAPSGRWPHVFASTRDPEGKNENP